MNHDENKSPAGSADAETEARIVAWIAGEASPFEIAELEKLLRARPELAIFKRRIEAVHGLLGEAARPEKEPLRLSSDRRAKLLQAMGVPADANTDAGTVQPVVLATTAAQRNRRWIYIAGTAAAACAMFALTIASLLDRPFRFGSSRAQVASARAKVAQDAKPLLLEMPAVQIDGVSPTNGAVAGARERDSAMAVQLNLAEAKADQPPPANQLAQDQSMDRSSFVRGPNAVLYGAGGAGGTANLSSAAPLTAPLLDQPPVKMDPFVVTTPDDVGFVGGGALAGGRLLPDKPALSLGGQANPAAGIGVALDGALRQGGMGGNARGGGAGGNADQRIAQSGQSFRGFGNQSNDEQRSVRFNSTLPSQKPAEEAVKLDAFSVSAPPPNPGFGFNGGLVGTQIASADNENQAAAAPKQKEAKSLRASVSQRATAASEKKVALNTRADPAGTTETIKLDSFSVAGDKDVGFVASSSLAGGRITTALKDTPVAYSALTPDFLKQFKIETPARENGPTEERVQLTPIGVDVDRKVPPKSAIDPMLPPPPAAFDLATKDLIAGLSPHAVTTVVNGKTETFIPTENFAGSIANQDRARPIEPRIATLDAERAGQQSQEISTAQEAISTFSLHVSDVSFRLAAAAFARGEAPDASRIRPEEFYNAFDYGDPTPAAADKIGCKIEQSAHPVLQQRNLLRIAMKVPSTGRGTGTPLRLTVLLDTSGSMEREDRAASVRRAFEVLVSLLGPNDRITLIGFARQPRLMAENLAGNEAHSLLALLSRTPADGGTNMEEALALASQLAQRHQTPGAQNRVVLLTDGAANLGNANPATLAERVTALRQHGIAFDACGVGLNGIDDDVLESLTRQGDGRYYVLNSPEAADSGFARQLAGAFRPAAENVKVQVRFNPARVAHQRLIGFEQHRLATEDFRNDAVDAAELAADEAAVALYQIEVLPQGTGEVGEVFVRFRDPASGQMVERSWTIGYEAAAPSFDRATPSLQLAGTAALLAEKLRHSSLGEQLKLGDYARVVDQVRQHYAGQSRVQEFVTMFGQARRMFRE